MDGTCNMHGRNEKCIQNFSLNTSREDILERLGIDGQIILK
jgi:hypothetical protein